MLDEVEEQCIIWTELLETVHVPSDFNAPDSHVIITSEQKEVLASRIFQELMKGHWLSLCALAKDYTGVVKWMTRFNSSAPAQMAANALVDKYTAIFEKETCVKAILEEISRICPYINFNHYKFPISRLADLVQSTILLAHKADSGASNVSLWQLQRILITVQQKNLPSAQDKVELLLHECTNLFPSKP